MTPTPQEHTAVTQELFGTQSADSEINDNAIVISGISGTYPQSRNVQELSDKLYNKVDPVTSAGLRWNYKHPEAAAFGGVVPDLKRFDAQFFTIFYRLGNYLDPMARKLLEQTFQAIYDAGLSPADLSGKKVAVFIGSSFSDMETRGMTDTRSETGLGIVGTNKAMFANRISYWLNVKGPSLGIDEIDCSSSIALEQAVSAIKRGDCESAIVGGANLNLNPHSSIYHKRLTSYQPADGKTKSFSVNADGYTLSDAVGVLFLQKKKNALRVYAEVTHVKNLFIAAPKDGHEPIFGFYRNPNITAEFIKEFYKEAHVSPQAVEYVEAYGTAVPEIDKYELEAIADVYCKEREEPLMVGSVASNIGITAAASTITGITKLILGYSNGELPGNLHCDSPREDIEALRDGRMRVLTDHQRFGRTYTAVNGMSVSGVNSHVLLHGHYKPKDLTRYKSAIPHLVTISGRQETAVQRVIDSLKSKVIDPEEIALLHNIHSRNISGHLGRGYVILNSDENHNTVSLGEKAEFFDVARRPLWFVYSGMGSQWAGMGAQLMRIPVFAAAIERCHQVLKPKGLDIVDIITRPDKSIFDNILNSFVGIAAVQIGLTDILNELGLKPDGIIGHSVGELGCAYADGCLTADEMILSAYSRGMASLETPLIRGSMAAVGLGYAEVSKMLPPGIDVACRNSSDSCTISGPADIMREFVAQLTVAGIFAKEVPCSNIAYHSRYIQDAGPYLLAYLKEVIKNPKRRSERWLSTSVPQDKWDEEDANLCSAEYHTNNLLSPVFFEETTKMIPKNAILVEVAPHGLLQAILKRCMPDECLNVPLTKRGHPDSAVYLLQALGGLYTKGYVMKMQALYPRVEFPVSTGTPMLSSLIEWVHVEEWFLPVIVQEEMIISAATQLTISVHDDDQSYLRGNFIRGNLCYPYASALTAVWDTLVMSYEMPKRELSVQFCDVRFHSQPLLHYQRPLQLDIKIQKGTGYFEVLNNRSRVISGYISTNVYKAVKKRDIVYDIENMTIASKDVYQLLEERGYNYEGQFRSIGRCDPSFSEAMLLWQNNWATFIDGMLQLNALRQSHDAISLPSHMKNLSIDVKEHVKHYENNINNKHVMKAFVSGIYNYTRCGGVTMSNILFKNVPPTTEILDSLKLVVPTGHKGYAKVETKSFRKGVTLQSSVLGKLESLYWTEVPTLDSSDLTVNVHYAAINLIDVNRASGTTPNEASMYGMEYSGVTKSGQRVMGIVSTGAINTQVNAQPEFLWPVPTHWSLEDAATVPLAYALAFYCLIIKGRLTSNMTVLVHGGAGALGQAVISILLAHNCRVLTTVSDVHKKRFLRKLYPQLKDEDIGYSRDIYFIDHVKATTDKQGCDIIISCLKGQLKDAFLRSLAYLGRYIDVTQDIDSEDYVFGMNHLRQEGNYIRADLTSLFTYKKYEDMKAIQSMLAEGIAKGYVRPLTRVTYEPQDVTRAFCLLAASRHRGRVLLHMQGNTINMQQRIACDPNQCHVLFSFNDILGVQLVQRLIKRGAKKICIYVPDLTMYYQFKVESWRTLGVEVTLLSDDLTESKYITNVLHNATRMGTVEGIYVVTSKSNGETKEDFKILLKNIDLSSRSLCPQLRYFTVVSNDGDLARDVSLSRAASGYPATSLDLSPLNHGQTAGACLFNYLAVEATERAMCSPFNVLQAQKEVKQAPSLAQQIAAIAGIQVGQGTNPDLTLRQLSMPDEKIAPIATYLNRTYNTALFEDDIPLLTINKINELEASLTEIVHENVRGLATFFTKGSSDDLLNTAEVLSLPTLFKDPSLINGEFDAHKRYLCILPGMESHHGRFHILCDHLKLPAVVLQTGIDNSDDTISQLGQKYADLLSRKNITQQNFYLLVYEAGALVALEMAAILEDKGFTGTIFLVGYDPIEFQIEFEEQLSDLKTQKQLEDALVRHMYKIMGGGDLTELDAELEGATTWARKVDIYVKYLRCYTTHSIQYVQNFLNTAKARIQHVRSYRAVARPLRSQVVLIRTATTRASPDFAKTLQPHSARAIAVHQLSAPLAHATLDIQTSAIVNRYLDHETLQEFNNKSQCLTYAVNEQNQKYY